ncbi:glycosyltransferase family 2 protein [Leptolyngbyaceae cyanobacterium CCMR0082]|uniref:Glycosyltransferase family 2 protein n=2 Tax=Adonisia turfae TaxID=2950184 RepID=A0A6M0SBA8_9CYAN|nr:glycosyltransferase family 2 protein [Adonisia turfae]NEZ59934.1 glycosyltransferase family 2 protein [Adonisia turfae CCMR0081]NEZ65799.1 glycosyltransferase family 2 protein [Adonisia turfae CCMR0082]
MASQLISFIILTLNEEKNLPCSLKSLQSLDAPVYIVDSNSSDKTIDIAKHFNCQVYQHPFESHAKQVNWALENLPISTPWVMRLDADERLTPELAKELTEVLANVPEDVAGYQVKRRVFFMGRWIRHGGYYPTWLMRIWRTGYGTCEQRLMDEHIVLSEGRIANLKHDIIDENQKGLSFWVDKHNRYADREVQDILSAQSRELGDALAVKQFSQARQRRWVKTTLYSRFPLFLRAFIYWLLRYTLGLGFLDGTEGLIFHFLQGFWYRFLVDAKLYEIFRHRKLQRTASNASTIEQNQVNIAGNTYSPLNLDLLTGDHLDY